MSHECIWGSFKSALYKFFSSYYYYYPYASITYRYNSVLGKGWWFCAAEKVTTGLAEDTGSHRPSLACCLHRDCVKLWHLLSHWPWDYLDIFSWRKIIFTLGVAAGKHRETAWSAAAESVGANIDGSHSRHSKPRRRQARLGYGCSARSRRQRRQRAYSCSTTEWQHSCTEWLSAVMTCFTLLSTLHLCSTIHYVYRLLCDSMGHVVLRDLQYLNQYLLTLSWCAARRFAIRIFFLQSVSIVGYNYGTCSFGSGICLDDEHVKFSWWEFCCIAVYSCNCSTLPSLLLFFLIFDVCIGKLTRQRN